MSKRQIERALKAKGLEAALINYGHFVTPGEIVGGWEIQLTEESEDKIAEADASFDDFDPDCRNTAEVIEWIETLPAIPPHKLGTK